MVMRWVICMFIALNQIQKTNIIAKGKVGRWLKLIAPWLVDRMALAAVKEDFRPRP